MEHPHQTEILKYYVYVVLHCRLCENETQLVIECFKNVLLFYYRTEQRGRYMVWLPFIT